MLNKALGGLLQWSTSEAYLAPVPSSTFHVHVCHPALPYLSTGLAGCSVDPGNSRGAHTLARIPKVIKKKKLMNKLLGVDYLVLCGFISSYDFLNANVWTNLHVF